MYRDPSCQSLAIIKRSAIKLLEKESNELPDIPSDEWIRLQFTPNNVWAYRSKKFTQRFDIKMGIQTRLTRKYHPDQKYGSVLFNYFKEFCVRHRDDICLYFLDDKCSIPIGSPNSPASTITRQRRCYGAGKSDACDHDHIQMHITPSVINKFGKPPKRIEDSFLEVKTQ